MTRLEKLGLIVGLFGLAATLFLFEIAPLDLPVQLLLYDAAAGHWLVDAKEPVGRFVFYNGPKIALWIFAAGLAGVLAAGRFRPALRVWRRTAIYLLACLALVPAAAGGLKQVTNTACPAQLEPFGGRAPYVSLFDSYPAAIVPARGFRCWPAGHASGGFALLGLGFVGIVRRRLWGFMPGLCVGSIMGFYQMAKGVHFLSHTLVTLFGAFAICAVLSWILKPLPRLDVQD